MTNVSKALSSLLACTCLASAWPLNAQPKAVKAEVWDVRGPVTVTSPGARPQAVNPATVLTQGSVIKTGIGAAVDISLGKAIGSIRLPQNSVLTIAKLQPGQDKGDQGFDVQLDLDEGALLGDVRRLPEAAKFDVKTKSAVTAVREGRFRLQAEGYLVLLKGNLLTVHVPASGEPSLHKLNGPPAVYFSPAEGVRPAPPVLVQEVQSQLQARLRSQ